MPPSIGTQGGGQQSGTPPLGGGGGKAIQSEVKPTMKTTSNKNFEFIIITILTVNILKNYYNAN